MFLFIIIYSLVFVLLTSIIDGFHNKERDIMRVYISNIPTDKVIEIGKASGLWHTLGLIRNAVFGGLTFIMIMWFISGNIWIVTKAFLMFFSISLLLMDGMISLIRGLSFEYYGSTDGKWDLFDEFWRTLYEKYKISQTLIKSIILIITIIIWFVL